MQHSPVSVRSFQRKNSFPSQLSPCSLARKHPSHVAPVPCASHQRNLKAISCCIWVCLSKYSFACLSSDLRICFIPRYHWHNPPRGCKEVRHATATIQCLRIFCLRVLLVLATFLRCRPFWVWWIWGQPDSSFCCRLRRFSVDQNWDSGCFSVDSHKDYVKTGSPCGQRLGAQDDLSWLIPAFQFFRP